MKMLKLGVNIDHVATLREARGGIEPEPVFAAFVCEAAGADSIVVHLREDRRHIKERDLFILRNTVSTRLNLEMSSDEEIVDIACKVRPDQATLVPEKRAELTTEGGLDVVSHLKRIKSAVTKLKRRGIDVSLFIDPSKKQIETSARLGVKIIELHTGRYADAKNEKIRNACFRELEKAAVYASSCGLTVNAGHGLDYLNTQRIAGMGIIEELNIGYAIICRAVFVGLERAVKEMKAVIRVGENDNRHRS